MDTTMAMFKRLGPMKMWSFVHELGELLSCVGCKFVPTIRMTPGVRFRNALSMRCIINFPAKKIKSKILAQFFF